ncbi:6753_t:CDS:10, partial [Acaulospora colombiana]
MPRFHPFHEELLKKWKLKLSIGAKLFSNPTLNEVFKDDPYIENWLQGLQDGKELSRSLSIHENTNIQSDDVMLSEGEQTQSPSPFQSESLKIIQNVRLKFEVCIQTGNSEKVDEALSEFNSLMRLPHAQLHKILEDLGLAQLNEEILTILCDDIVRHEDIAYQNYVVFFRYAFLEKVRRLTSKPSRNLLSTITNTAKAKGKPIVYGLLLPLITESSEIETPQLEVITRTIDSGLDEDSVVALLTELFSNSYTPSATVLPSSIQSLPPPIPQRLTQWTDSMIEIVFTIINQNFQIESSHALTTSNQSQSIFSKLLFYLDSNIERLPTHTKLCQILMLLVTKHANSVMDNLDEIREIAEKSKAFIRKGIIGRDITKPPLNPVVSEEEITRNIEAIRINKGRGVKSKKSSKSSSIPANDPSDDKRPTRKKAMRVWDDKVTEEEMKSLDYSGQNGGADESPGTINHHLVDENQLGYFQNGQKEITEQNLAPVLAQMKEHLIKKNVAADIATHLCDSVARNLVGQKTGNFKTIQSTVKQSMEVAAKRILTPKTSVDLLRDISQAQAESRPYTICFIGVNGVGKSTNLSKTCFWLLQNGLKVLIAACDTFRSGAVEQLRVHVRNLNALGQNSTVELYERGYGKDAAGIAKDAINYGKVNRFDVVLIDTAGRMQDNEPLMRALAKLVSVNNPDKIIFVGEALVGNEAVDQLTKFNQALKDFSGLQNPRHIDGIILTKFDTIDDKVGAALSMAYITGQPILFVGTGQTYTDLKTMR